MNPHVLQSVGILHLLYQPIFNSLLSSKRRDAGRWFGFAWIVVPANIRFLRTSLFFKDILPFFNFCLISTLETFQKSVQKAWSAWSKAILLKTSLLKLGHINMDESDKTANNDPFELRDVRILLSMLHYLFFLGCVIYELCLELSYGVFLQFWDALNIGKPQKTAMGFCNYFLTASIAFDRSY